MLDNKSDILFLIMGTNPFPNLISLVTRLKKGGDLICICTKETAGDPYVRFRKLFKKKKINGKIDYIIVDKSNRQEIERELEKKLKSILLQNNEIDLLELNYTGGTKVMSSTAYDTIKNYDYGKYNENIEINLTYIDSEREVIYGEYKRKASTSYSHYSSFLWKLDADYILNIEDIISTYNNIENINTKKAKASIEVKELSNELGGLFCNINYEEYLERIKFFEEIDKISKKKKEGRDILKKEINEVFLDYKLIPEYKNLDSWGFEDDKEIIKYFNKTKWLEEYILNILIELKEEGTIDDVLSNVTKIHTDEHGEFEVDAIAYRKYKLYAISITSIDKEEYAKSKLYEIRQRSRDLAGDEAGICYINLCWNIDSLEKEYKNIWDNFLPKNTLILGASDFSNLKIKLKEWMMGGEKIE